MTTTLALANQKGGVAKTTSVASIGAALAELGQRDGEHAAAAAHVEHPQGAARLDHRGERRPDRSGPGGGLCSGDGLGRHPAEPSGARVWGSAGRLPLGAEAPPSGCQLPAGVTPNRSTRRATS